MATKGKGDALDKMMRARIKLVLDQPFFGMLTLSQLRLQLREDLPAAMATDGRTLYFRSKEVLAWSLSEVCAVICHEVLHAANGHIWRVDGRDKWRFNVACVREDTQVIMADQTTQRIDQITAGSYVQSPFGPSRVIGVLDSGEHEVVQLDVVGGDQLFCTASHRILTQEGWTDAVLLTDQAQGYIYPDARRRAVCVGESQDDEPQGAVERYDGGVSHRGDISGKTRTACVLRSTIDPTDQSSTTATTESDRMGVSGGVGGWRRNDHDSVACATGTPILPDQGGGYEYLIQALCVSQKFGLLSGRRNEQLGASLLVAQHHRLPDGRLITWDAALFNHQAGTRAARAALYRHAATTTTPSRAHSADAQELATDQGDQSARLSVRAGIGRAHVYDLITEHHCYYANGLLTHNCDFAINPVVKECGMTLPAGCLFKEEWAGKSAEEIYRLLPKDLNKLGLPNDPLGQDLMDGACHEDGTPLTGAEKKALEREWKQAVQQALHAAKMQGKVPAELDRMAGEFLRPQCDWKALLARFIQNAAKADYSWKRPNRRYLGAGIWLPSLYSEAMRPIVVAIDTSGSVGEAELQVFVSELNGIISAARPERTHLLWADAAVAGVQTFEQGDPVIVQPKGGGGTDFRPVFEWVEENDTEDVACVIYLTDMYGTFPDVAPTMPVLWVATSDVQGPWGETIRLEQSR